MVNKMKLVFASDAFKGSLSSKKTARILTKAATETFGECECVPVVIADGGEGTLDALMNTTDGVLIPTRVHDPLMREINSVYGVFGGNRAVVEMAQASGLTLVESAKRNPLYTSSFGTGELIRSALINGYRDVTIAIGGSAINDGGMGAMTALGIRFFDKDGRLLDGRGDDLSRVCDIDTGRLIPEAGNTAFTVMCDVTNPLCGEHGATYVYGPQKGAGRYELEALEDGMQNYRRVLIKTFGVDPDEIKGAGAAGGMGAALRLFLGADMCSGIETLLDLTGFNTLIRDADYIITGEGRLDGQSSAGKAVQGIGDRAKKAGVPCIALCGCLGDGYEHIKEHGITRIEALADDSITPEYAVSHAEEVYYQRALEVMKTLKG